MPTDDDIAAAINRLAVQIGEHGGTPDGGIIDGVGFGIMEDGAETEMRASLQRMFDGGPFELPSNLHPLNTGIELLTEPSAGALPPSLLRWLDCANEILRQPAPPAAMPEDIEAIVANYREALGKLERLNSGLMDVISYMVDSGGTMLVYEMDPKKLPPGIVSQESRDWADIPDWSNR